MIYFTLSRHQNQHLKGNRRGASSSFTRSGHPRNPHANGNTTQAAAIVRLNLSLPVANSREQGLAPRPERSSTMPIEGRARERSCPGLLVERDGITRSARDTMPWEAVSGAWTWERARTPHVAALQRSPIYAPPLQETPCTNYYDRLTPQLKVSSSRTRHGIP